MRVALVEPLVTAAQMPMAALVVPAAMATAVGD